MAGPCWGAGCEANIVAPHNRATHALPALAQNVHPPRRHPCTANSCMSMADGKRRLGTSKPVAPHLQLVVQSRRLGERDATTERQATAPKDALSQLLHCRKLCQRRHVVKRAAGCGSWAGQDREGGVGVAAPWWQHTETAGLPHCRGMPT